MDKTKKYTIIFIIICFIGIGVAGFFSQTPSSTSKTKSLVETNKQEESVSIQDNQEKQNQSEEKKTETKESQTEKSKQSKDHTTSKQEQSNKQSSNTSSTSNQSQQSKTTTESKQEESVSKPNEEVVQETPQSQVYISIQDINGIVASETLSINDGDTAYSVLKTLCNQKGISMSTKGYGKIIYVKEINGLSEFDYGNMSGWKYKVNGVYPNVGAGAYTLKDGDRVEWVYTTEG